jgi:dTDP-4-dehydrorhamnose reductase
MKMLVTGASGLLGRKVVNLALKRGHTVFSAYNEHPAEAGIALKLNLTNIEDVKEAIYSVKPDAIIHAAAYTNVDGCEENKDLAWQVNAEACKHIAVSSANLGIHLIYVSTDYVFNGEKGFYNEEDAPNPINFYGYTKLMGEEFIKQYAKSWCIARTSVIYGWGGSKLNFATWLIKNLKHKNQVNVLIDQYVSPTLNTNLAQMLIEIAERKLCCILHTAGASRVSRYEFAQTLASIFNLNPNLIKPIKMNELQWKAKRPKDSSLNITKCLNTLMKAKPLKLSEALKAMKLERQQQNRLEE